jgi:hypothetical protein
MRRYRKLPKPPKSSYGQVSGVPQADSHSAEQLVLMQAAVLHLELLGLM